MAIRANAISCLNHSIFSDGNGAAGPFISTLGSFNRLGVGVSARVDIGAVLNGKMAIGINSKAAIFVIR